MDRVRNILRAQRGKTFIDLPGLRRIPFEPHVRELGVRGSGMNGSNFYTATQEVDPHAMRDGVDRSFGTTVYIPFLIDLLRRHAAKIDDMPMTRGNQQWKHSLRHI